MAQPDLRTLEGALEYLDYHSPNDVQVKAHAQVNAVFQTLLNDLWNFIPDGPGKTVAVRELNRARMTFNSAIANDGG
jgi:hypothetical protein